MNNDLIFLGEDLGMGANKLYGLHGGLQTLSQVSINGSQKIGQMLGLRNKKPPLHISATNGDFYVGAGAHDWGRPVENLDYERLNGSSEMQALFKGAITRYMQRYGEFDRPLSLTVGMPLEPLKGDDAKENSAAVKRWMQGVHEWEADGVPMRIEVAEVKITSQPVGALFDHLLDEQGSLIAARQSAFKKEVGIISIGFNTVELLVVRDKQPVQRFTAGATSGVRRLLEIVNHGQMYSLGELDSRLRAGRLDMREALPIWEREVGGVIERTWGTSWKRFAAILLVGGGAVLLKEPLTQRFAGKAYIPEKTVLSIASGLYKLGLFQANRKRK
ncbi:MAG: ParM/StbA family protein [Anaerolineae bacterium]|jgi:hypothetical protein|nr:ParM/StbA family protein [Anaerolineae bacterium]